eukprot:TRINITY_DN4562_c0_g2_i1.p1 TRINITY_DN4562_c0_g2~~TRINITY_DN4562_c0_g2_i1.p1  ORF type:complete len:1800 (+),score=380.97 TRINITY_DN4562_c0_g2_i1:135-5402(+)
MSQPLDKLQQSIGVRAAGANQYGQCCVGPRDIIPLSLLPSGSVMEAAERIALGIYFTAVLTAQGEVLTAGCNDSGQLGQGTEDGDPHPELRAVPLPCPAVDVACGYQYLLICLRDGRVLACGSNKSNQCGVPGEGTFSELKPVSAVGGVVRVFAGYDFSFALCRGGEVVSFGNNSSGELAQGSASLPQGPQRAAALCGVGVREITAGEYHALALLEDGGVLGWGRLGRGGPLLDGSPWSAECGAVPIRLSFGGAPVRALSASAGWRHCAVATVDGRLWLWGSGDTGALGFRNAKDVSEPRALALPGGQQAVEVQCGWYTTFVTVADGRVYACGDKDSGLPFDMEEEEEKEQEEEEEESEAGHFTLQEVPFRCVIATSSLASHAFYRCSLTSSCRPLRLLGDGMRAAAGLPELPLADGQPPALPRREAAAMLAEFASWIRRVSSAHQMTLAKGIELLEQDEVSEREALELSEAADLYTIRFQLRVRLNKVRGQQCERRSIVCQHAEQVVCTIRGIFTDLSGLLCESEQDMETTLRRFAWFREQRDRVQLYQAADFSQLCIEADADAARIATVQHTLVQELGAALRAAALARTVRLTIEYLDVPDPSPGLPPRGVYLRAFADCDGGPQWKSAQGGSVATVLQCPGVAGSKYRIVQGDKDPVEAAVLGGQLRCGHGGAEVLRLPSGSCVTLEVAAKAEPPTLPGFCPELLRKAESLPQLAAHLGPDSQLYRIRHEAWRQRIIFAEMQTHAQSAPGNDGARARRDAARAAACEAQRQLVATLRSPEVTVACGEDRQRELEDLSRRLAASAPAVELGGGDASRAYPAAVEARSAASRALNALAVWQSKYSDAVKDAERATDLALSAARRFTERTDPSLGELLKAIHVAAAEEAGLRVRPEGVTTPPREEFSEAASSALDAIESLLGAAAAVHEEALEAEAVLAELSEGCRYAETGFYDRLERFVGDGEPDSPDADALQSYEEAKQELEVLQRRKAKGKRVDPEEIIEAEQEVERTKALTGGSALTVQALQKQAMHMRVDIECADSPERRRAHERRRDEILRRLRIMRRERVTQGAELLRIANAHFPECLEMLKQGIHQSLAGQVPLRLLLGGGTLDDFVPLSGDRGGQLSHRHRVYRAESSDGEVVVKQVDLSHHVALSSFIRSVRMAEAAGDVAAEIRSVFIDGEYGCVVMDSYPHNLLSWAAQGGDEGLAHTRVLRMAQLLLERIVRLHSPVPDFPGGVVHGDITPANIVVDTHGVPYFIDFEMARTASGATTGTVHVLGMTPPYAAPELRVGGVGVRDPDKKTTKATDIYGMGATIKELVQKITGPGKEPLLRLCERMTHRDPAQRPTAVEALAGSDLTAAVGAEMRERQVALAERQREAEAAAAGAERRRSELQAMRQQVDERLALLTERAAETTEECRREREELRMRAAKLSSEAARQAAEADQLHKKRGAVEAEAEKLRREFYTSPKHWSGLCALAQGWRAVAIPAGSDIYACLGKSLATDAAKLMAHGGRDRKVRGTFSRFELQRAWRIEHPARWREYAFKRDSIRHDILSGRLPKDTPPLIVRREVAETLGPKVTVLPEPLHNRGGVNELRLFHGTEPGSLLGIISGGMNERLCGQTGTLFGGGTYYAEDAGKCDQYGTIHKDKTLPDLEGRLYRDGVTHPGGDVFYMLVCRVVCGCYVTSKDGLTSVTGGHRLFATADRRELVSPPGVGPTGARYNSILAETGGRIDRYREFIIFNGQQVFTEYVLAYHRK